MKSLMRSCPKIVRFYMGVRFGLICYIPHDWVGLEGLSVGLLEKFGLIYV